jgi:hypothetical protein
MQAFQEKVDAVIIGGKSRVLTTAATHDIYRHHEAIIHQNKLYKNSPISNFWQFCKKNIYLTLFAFWKDPDLTLKLASQARSAVVDDGHKQVSIS